MQKRQLGASDVQITPILMGTWQALVPNSLVSWLFQDGNDSSGRNHESPQSFKRARKNPGNRYQTFFVLNCPMLPNMDVLIVYNLRTHYFGGK
jgi:hypothetical protein